MAGRIFISYRRGDDPGTTGRLFDQLEDVFPRDRLFMDVDSIPPGHDFVRELYEQVAQCDVLLAVIGKDWLDARDVNGVRRLDKPDDFVRIEIASALKQGKGVIPVLVNNVEMPGAADLPEPLKSLARRNAARLTHERFRTDVRRLIKALEGVLHDADAAREAAKSPSLSELNKEGSRKPPGAILTFEDHATYTDAPRRPLLSELRRRVLSLDDRLPQGEQCTSGQRIAYKIPGHKIFLEVKVRRAAIVLHLADGGCPDPAGIADDIPESHGWRQLKKRIAIVSMADLEAAMPFIEAAYRANP